MLEINPATGLYNFMSPENQKLIRARILEAAQSLEGRLPNSSKHPMGRNPYAHIPKVIKTLTGISYKDLTDEYFDAVMEIIDHCERNPF